MFDRPHDHLVRAIFGRPDRAAAELRSVLPNSLLAELDLATLEAVPATFIDGALRDRAADLLFTARARGGGTALVHLLIEHQSRIDRWMALRLLDYQQRIWERWRREHPDGNELPRIIPVVLYRGERPWPHPTRFVDLIGGAPVRDRAPLREGALDFRWWLDDLTRCSDEQLRARALDAASLLTLLALKHARHATDLGERLLSWATLMNEAARAAGGREVLLLVLRYLSAVSDRISRGFLRQELAPRLAGSTAKEATMTLAEELIAEGRDLERRDLFLKLLRQRFGAVPAAAAARVQSATAERVESWALRLFDARSIEDALPD